MILPYPMKLLEQKKAKSELEAYKTEVQKEPEISIPAVNWNPITFYNITKEVRYYDMLDYKLGYVTVPKLNITYQILKGTTEKELQNGVGLFEGSDVPEDRKGIHSVIVGHNGVYGREYFSNLKDMVLGDKVEITVLDKTFEYKVVEIKTVLPDEAKFEVDEKKNYVTLVTCTPYGSNSHRLLVKCERME